MNNQKELILLEVRNPQVNQLIFFNIIIKMFLMKIQKY